MRLAHFEALHPVCPRCRRNGEISPLALGSGTPAADDILEGTLACQAPTCRLEFPIVDGIPIIVPDVRAYIASMLPDILARDDLGEAIESLLGDAAPTGSDFEARRQRLSIYAWDGYGAEDPGEAADGPRPGAVLRCLDALLELAGGAPPDGPVLDIGCAVGATSFALARRSAGLVLGIDLNFAMLRLARRVALTGEVRYPRRRIGLVYDRRRFQIDWPHAARVDFWAADVLALPFADGAAGLVSALNILDCVTSPLGLLGEIERVLAPGGKALLATPYDWTPGATEPAAWIGGHSQRGGTGGAAEPLLEGLLTPNALPQSLQRLHLVGRHADWPWQTRLHERSLVTYRLHMVAAEVADPA